MEKSITILLLFFLSQTTIHISKIYYSFFFTFPFFFHFMILPYLKSAVHCVNTFRYSNRVDPEDLVPQWPLVSKFREQEEPSDEVKVD